MNGKFSTLMASLLLASAFTANAGVVKVTPVKGKQYVIGVENAATGGKFTENTGILNAKSDKSGVEAAIAEKNATALADDLTKWFVSFTIAGEYRISLEAAKYYLAASSTDEITINEEPQNEANKAKDTWKNGDTELGTNFAVPGTVDCVNQIKFSTDISGTTVGLKVAGDEMAFYANAYDANAETGLLNEIKANDYVFITIGGKYVKVKEIPAGGDDAVAEIELVSELKTVEDKYLATFQASALGGGVYTSIALSDASKNNKKLTAGAATEKLTVGAAGTAFKYDGDANYQGVKGASLFDAGGNFIDKDGVTTEVGEEDPSDRPEVLIYSSSQILMAPGAIAAEDFVSGNKYLLSTNGAHFLSMAENGAAEDTETPNKNALWEVKETKDASGVYSYTLYNVGREKYLKLTSTTFISGIEGQGYTGGIVLKTANGKFLKYTAGGNTYTAVGEAVVMNQTVFGFYTPGYSSYTAEEMQSIENDKTFQMTVALSKATIGKNTINGADIFDGALTVKAGNKTDKVFQLQDKEGKYIVLAKEAWGATNGLNGATNNEGLKFKKVDDPAKVDGCYSWFKIGYPLSEGPTFQEVSVEVYKEKAAENMGGRMMIIDVNKNYYLSATTNANSKAFAYVTLGGASLVDLTEEFVAAPTYYSIVKVNEDGKALKALGVAFDDEGQWLDMNAVQLDQPEGQWYATSETNNMKLVLANRENPNVKKEFASLYKTDKTTDLRAASTIYKSGTDYLVLTPTAVADAKTSDGYEIWENNNLRDEAFTLGISTLFGKNAYLAENHEGKHQLGLVESEKEAATWKFTALTGKGKADGSVITDSVYVKNEITYWNANKKGGAGWDKKVDYLKLVPYTIANAENGEPLWYSAAADTASYICNPSGEADRFVVKKSADGKYNFIRVVKKDGAWVLNQKMYAGLSAQYGNVQLTNIYQKRENDAFVIEKAAAPEYLKLNLGDTIRIFREGAESSLLFEKGEFLGLENIYEFTKMAPAMYVDTAFVNRTGKDNYINNRYQYLLAVEPDRHQTSEECTIPGHPSHSTDITYGRYLVSLKDSADVEAKRNLHTNKYLNTEGLAKFGFVKASHANDTLVIANSVYTGTLKQDKDSIYMGTKDFKGVKFAFKVADQETKAFRIQTDDKKFLKWMNGFIVAAEGEANGDIFNLKATDENPTANEAIAAEGVQVIAGKGAVTVQGAAGKVITVANILGQTIANQVAASDNVTIAAPAGVVVVAVEGDATKVVVK